jgi:hypothetical protein
VREACPDVHSPASWLSGRAYTNGGREKVVKIVSSLNCDRARDRKEEIVTRAKTEYMCRYKEVEKKNTNILREVSAQMHRVQPGMEKKTGGIGRKVAILTLDAEKHFV